MPGFLNRGGLDLAAAGTSTEVWQVELDRLELDVLRAERALADNTLLRTDPWDLPGVRGPMPEELREQAVSLLERQRAVTAALAQRLGATARQQSVVDRLDLGSPLDNLPVYLDVSA